MSGLVGRHVGVDLDNTIIDYSRVFGPVGVELGLLSSAFGTASKREVKAHLQAQPDGEALWMRLQGQVYGRFILRAEPYPEVRDVLAALARDGASLSIVSHKTRSGHFDADRVDLWEAARSWLAANRLHDAGIDPANVHFRETRDAKVARIAELGCDIFVDDLPEVLTHPAFPAATARVWFTGPADEAEHPVDPGLVAHTGWAAVAVTIRTRFQDLDPST